MAWARLFISSGSRRVSGLTDADIGDMELPEIEAARKALAEERAAWRAEEAEELDAVREGGPN